MKKWSIISSNLVLIFTIIFICFSSGHLLKAETSRIDIVGNSRISDETIRVISGLSLYNNFPPDVINAALIRLNDSGLFSDVQIVKKSGSLLITVKENLVISEIFFEGNKILTDQELFNEIESKRRNAFMRDIVLRDVDRLLEYYKSKGRFNAEIVPQFINDNDGSLRLIFSIEEGNLLEVGDIVFVGNKAFSDKKLSSITPSRKKGLFSFLSDADNYSDKMLLSDMQALETFYKSNGFIDFEVKSSFGIVSQINKDEIVLSYSIFEGPQYRVGKVDLNIEEFGLLKENYSQFFQLQPGQIYREEDITDIVKKVERKLINSGRPLAKVTPIRKKNVNVGVIDLEFVFESDRRLFVERIEIRGNNQTLDRVIRREFDLVEGDAFNPLMLKKTEEKLRAKGFFERVDFSITPGSSNEKVNIFVDVTEAPTGSLNFGIGYSTDTNVTGSLSLSERNLLGKGQRLNLNLSISESSQALNFGFTEPAYLGRDLSAGIDLKFQKVDPSESEYTSDSASLSPTFGFKTGPNSRLAISYDLESLRINSEDSSSAVLQKDDGRYLNSGVNTNFIFDKRNSIVEPTDGYIVRLDNNFSGLGGNVGIIKNSLRAKAYEGFLNDSIIVSGEVEGGILRSFKGFSRITDRFKLGGRNFRGFQYGEVGPRDVSGDALGGEKYVMGRLETNFPLGLPKELGLYGGVFFETGSLWSLKSDTDVVDSILHDNQFFRSSSGVSLYWSTPIGPLQFNWSQPMNYLEGVDITEKFSLNLATRF